MKHYLHVFILVLLPVAAVFAQPRYSVEKIPMCWTVGSTDSSITKVVLISSASDQLVTIGYYNADGNDITVSGGSLQFGYCGTGGGGGDGDDDWRWYGAVETYSKPLYRIGKTNIFVTTAADTTHGFRVDSTFQFRTDGGRDIFDWQVGGGTGTDYTPHAGLFYRGRNTFESSLVGSGHNNITLGADDNTISDRDRLGAIIFAGKNPAGSGGYRPGAMITAFADVPAGGWSGDSSATSLNFYVTRPNANTLTNTVTFQRDGRVELDRYQFFEDGVPERMLGFDDGSDDVTVHSIDGTPGNNSILGLNATGSGFEWKDQSDVANAGIRYTVYQPAHGFTLPAHGFIPVYRDSVTGWELALANDSTKLHSAYVVEVINSDSIVLMEAGILTVTGGHGLGFGDYFLTNAGSISMSPGTYNDWVATVWDTLTVALKATRPVAPGDTTTYVSGVDIDGSLRLRAISTPASVEDGEMWTSSTQKAITANQAGVNQTLVGTIFTGTSDATIANSVTETSITPTGVGTLTLPANFFVVGKTIEIEAWGVHTEDVVPTTLDLKLKLGSTVIASTGAQTMVTTASGQWKASFTLTCRTVGGSGTVFAQGDVRFNSSEIVGVTHAARNSAATTIDTTASQAVTITATHGAADTDNSITTNLLTIKVLN